MTIDVKFLDAGRTAENPPDPKHPDGVAVDLRAHVLQRGCTRNLPYPAPRCGAYSVRCRTCNFIGVVTVAGRADDPRIVTIPCKAN